MGRGKDCRGILILIMKVYDLPLSMFEVVRDYLIDYEDKYDIECRVENWCNLIVQKKSMKSKEN